MPDPLREYETSDLPETLHMAMTAILRCSVLAFDVTVPEPVRERLADAACAVAEALKVCPERMALEVASFRRDDDGQTFLHGCFSLQRPDPTSACTAPLDRAGVCLECGQVAMPF